MVMAMLASRAAKVPAMERMSNLLRNSFFLRRDFSSSASTANTTPLKKSKRKKKKNLFEVAQFLPNWGIGYHMAKAHWSGVSYQVTKINLYKDGKHGKAWGVVHKEGLPAADAPKKISGVHKRCWRYIPNLKTTVENVAPSSKSTPESSTKPELNAA